MIYHKGETARELTSNEIQTLARLSHIPKSPAGKEAISGEINDLLIDFTRSEYQRGVEEGMRTGLARVVSKFDSYDVVVKVNVNAYRNKTLVGGFEFNSTIGEVYFAVRATTGGFKQKEEGLTFKVSDLSVSIGGQEASKKQRQVALRHLDDLANWTSRKHGAYATLASKLSKEIVTDFIQSNKNPDIFEGSRFNHDIYVGLLEQKEAGNPLSKAEEYLLAEFQESHERHLNSQTAFTM